MKELDDVDILGSDMYHPEESMVSSKSRGTGFERNDIKNAFVIPSLLQRFRFTSLAISFFAAMPPVTISTNANADERGVSKCGENCAGWDMSRVTCLSGQASMNIYHLKKPSEGLACLYEIYRTKSGKNRLTEKELLDEVYKDDTFGNNLLHLSLLARAYFKLGDNKKASDALVLLLKKFPSVDNSVSDIKNLRSDLESQGFDIDGKLRAWESSDEEMPDWLKTLLGGLIVAGAIAYSSDEDTSTKSNNSDSSSPRRPPENLTTTENSLPSSIRNWIETKLLPEKIREKWGSRMCCPGPISAFRVDGVATDGSNTRVHISGTIKLTGGLYRHIEGHTKADFGGEIVFRVYGNTYRFEGDDITIGKMY